MIATFSVGYDHIDLNECAARNIRVCNCPYEDSGESLYFIVEYQGLQFPLKNTVDTLNGPDGTIIFVTVHWVF